MFFDSGNHGEQCVYQCPLTSESWRTCLPLCSMWRGHCSSLKTVYLACWEVWESWLLIFSCNSRILHRGATESTKWLHSWAGLGHWEEWLGFLHGLWGQRAVLPEEHLGKACYRVMSLIIYDAEQFLETFNKNTDAELLNHSWSPPLTSTTLWTLP